MYVIMFFNFHLTLYHYYFVHSGEKSPKLISCNRKMFYNVLFFKTQITSLNTHSSATVDTFQILLVLIYIQPWHIQSFHNSQNIETEASTLKPKIGIGYVKSSIFLVLEILLRNPTPIFILYGFSPRVWPPFSQG